MQYSDPYLMANILFVLLACCCACLKSDDKKDKESEYRRTRRDERGLGEVYPRRYSRTRRSTRTRRPIPGVASSISSTLHDSETGRVKALRGGEFIGNRMRFKVKVIS